jgi:hypothetical protein
MKVANIFGRPIVLVEAPLSIVKFRRAQGNARMGLYRGIIR